MVTNIDILLKDIDTLLKKTLDLKIFDTNIISFFARLVDATNKDSLVENKESRFFNFKKLSLLAILLVKTGLVFEILVAVIMGVVHYLESDRMLLG